MYPQMVYHADVRAREMELAAERQMGCSCGSLGRMISRVITKCNGRQARVRYDDRMDDYAMASAPAQTCYVRPTARTVNLATTNHHPAHAVQPEPPRAHATTTLPGTPFPSTGAAPPQGARKPKKKKKKNQQVRFAPSGPVTAGEPPPPHAEHHTSTAASSGGGDAAGTASVVYHHGAAEPPPPYSPAPPLAHGGQGGHGYYGYGYGRYTPSPLTRWEVVGTPRRHEYFSSEYRWYYPTPVREGIYSIATDANGRLSTIFSEENPNACTIV